MMGWVDKVTDWGLTIISPKRAAVRSHLRRMDSDAGYRETWLAALRARGYRAADQSKSKTPWLGGGRSADAEILTGLPTLRNRSRELERDDPLGDGLLGTFVSNVIGTGMRPQARTGDPEKNERIEEVWKERKDHLSLADGLSHGESQRLLMRCVLRDGGVLRKRAVRDAFEPVWFETVESDRLATPSDFLNDKNFRDGVERDDWGVPTKYWIMKQHPGDTMMPGLSRGKDAFVGVDVDSIRHLRVVERPGQTRGVPMFHAVLQDMRDLDLLILASLKRVQVAACLSVFIKSPESMSDIAETTAQKYGYQMDQSLEPGMMWKLYPDEEIQTLTPNFPTPELEPFIIMLARRIGAALGVSWQVVLKDFSKANYSSARTDLLEGRQVYLILQSWFVEKYLNWEWAVVLEDARLRGDTRLRDVTDADLQKVYWIANGWKWVDPVKEAAGAKLELEMGTTSLRDLCAAKGQDWEEVLEQRILEEKKERDLREKYDVPAPEKAKSDNAPPMVADDDEEDDDETDNAKAKAA